MFHKRLKELREERGLSQRDLAKVLNVAPSTIGMYETDKRDPDINTISTIANYFNVSTDYLLGRSDYRSIPHAQAAHLERPGITEDVLDQIEEILKKAREEYKKEKGNK